jgi:hypothetical protein
MSVVFLKEWMLGACSWVISFSLRSVQAYVCSSRLPCSSLADAVSVAFIPARLLLSVISAASLSCFRRSSPAWLTKCMSPMSSVSYSSSWFLHPVTSLFKLLHTSISFNKEKVFTFLRMFRLLQPPPLPRLLNDWAIALSSKAVAFE